MPGPGRRGASPRGRNLGKRAGDRSMATSLGATSAVESPRSPANRAGSEALEGRAPRQEGRGAETPGGQGAGKPGPIRRGASLERVSGRGPRSSAARRDTKSPQGQTARRRKVARLRHRAAARWRVGLLPRGSAGVAVRVRGAEPVFEPARTTVRAGESRRQRACGPDWAGEETSGEPSRGTHPARSMVVKTRKTG